MKRYNPLIIAVLLIAIGLKPAFVFAEPSQISTFSPGETYRSLTRNGVWCWFSDPRAVYHEGQKKATYAGWVNGFGDIVVAAYDHATGKIDTAVLHEKLEVDDHANPSILVRQDGRLLVFYSKHSKKDGPLSMRLSTLPEDIRGWERERRLLLNENSAYPSSYRRDFCYTNPYRLAAENNKIYLFWRGIDFKPCFSTSTDGGQTWETGRMLIMSEDTYPNRRPYVKYDSKGRDRIHIAFTDGHPRNEKENSIYYACYRNGSLIRADGRKIVDLNALPITPRQADVVYDATRTGVRAWIWDVAEDEKGNPVLVYSRLPAEGDHRYHYAFWDGKTWQDREVTPAGKWFPETPAGAKEPEPHYSGGIALDHANPSVVYCSRLIEDVFEIEKWTIQNKGKSWKKESVTSGSVNDNVRPFVVRNHPATGGPRLLWMNNRKYVHYTDYDAAIKTDIPLQALSPEMDPDAVVQAMTRVADWQLANPSRHETTDWTHGALFAGLTAWALMSDDSTYLKACYGFSEKNAWKPGPRIYHADDHCVGAMYQELYGLDRNPAHLKPIQERFDWILKNPSSVTLKRNQQKGMDRWWWCDALFMGPPVWTGMAVLTGDRKYLDFMNSEWWLTTDYLYDKDEHLFFRDDGYFDRREANGKKIFWSRGNGWVMGGLARVLQNMPKDYPARPQYVGLFKDMSARLAAVQPKNGLWRPSLLDPDSYPNPETSGSGFFCYALAWGINNGFLDRATYLPAVQKAWAGLVKSVHPDGKLGFVQPIGADPKHVNADQTEIYGVGAFLLAGTEVYKLALFGDALKAVASVSNPVTLFRSRETVSLDWNEVKRKLPLLNRDNVSVFDSRRNRFLVIQILNDEKGNASELLFQNDWAPNETREFWVAAKPRHFQLLESCATTFGMFVPQRKDDFAWENDRIAFRMYGKALEDETVSSGVDVWVKKVRYPIVEKWYKTGDYHADHGEGLDFFKVGPSLGCGGSAVWKDGRLFGSRNFRTAKILANGPIRTVFELGYEPWNAGGMTVNEVKRIALDLGSNLSRFESRYSLAEPSKDFEAAVGAVKIENGGEMTYNLKERWMGYWQPPDSINGSIACGVVMAKTDSLRFADQSGHGLFITPVKADRTLLYYAGAGWSESGDFPSRECWNDYVKHFAKGLNHPLRMKWAR